MKRLKLFIVLCLGCLNMLAQEKPPMSARPKFDRKEEIIHDGKRYRIHNCYLSLGGGFMQSNIRSQLQRSLGIDFHFPIRYQNFQVGVLMSGNEFASNNNVQGHACYGLRKESRGSNLALYFGPSYSTGVEGDASGQPRFYQGPGLYLSVQAVAKLAYDIGLGAELFGDISNRQNIVGIKIIVFFSGAYRGPKKNFNPNVRSENPK